MTERRELYRGQDIVVIERPIPDSDCLVITFTPLNSTGERRSGYGEALFEKHGVSAIHFIGLSNHWWQTPEMAEAVAVVMSLGLRQRFRHITTYGASMGGHGAMLFAGPLEADQALAFSPQFANGGRNAVWTRHWPVLTELYRYEDTHPTGVRVTVVYDPAYPFDRRHLEAFRAVTPVETVRTTFSKHATAPALAEMKALSGFVIDYVKGGGDVREMNALFRARRRDSVICWKGVAQLLSTRAHKGVFHQRAVEKGMAVVLDRFARGETVDPANYVVPLLRPYARALVRRGQAARALEIAQACLAATPASPGVNLLTAKLLGDAGRHDEALEVLKAAFQNGLRTQAIALGAAGAALDAGRRPVAKTYLDAAFAMRKQDPEALARFALAFSQKLTPQSLQRVMELAEKAGPDVRAVAQAKSRLRKKRPVAAPSEPAAPAPVVANLPAPPSGARSLLAGGLRLAFGRKG